MASFFPTAFYLWHDWDGTAPFLCLDIFFPAHINHDTWSVWNWCSIWLGVWWNLISVYEADKKDRLGFVSDLVELFFCSWALPFMWKWEFKWCKTVPSMECLWICVWCQKRKLLHSPLKRSKATQYTNHNLMSFCWRFTWNSFTHVLWWENASNFSTFLSHYVLKATQIYKYLSNEFQNGKLFMLLLKSHANVSKDDCFVKSTDCVYTYPNCRIAQWFFYALRSKFSVIFPFSWVIWNVFMCGDVIYFHLANFISLKLLFHFLDKSLWHFWW